LSTAILPELPSRFRQPLNTPLDLISFGIEIQETIKVAARVVSILSSPSEYLFTSTYNIVSFNQLCCAIEHRLLSAEISHEERSSEEQAHIYIYEAARISALLSVNYSFRKFSLQSAVFRSLRHDLLQTIVDIGSLRDLSLDEYSVQLLLWACWCGQIAFRDQKCFLYIIKGCLHKLNYTTLEEVDLCLRAFIWTQQLHDQYSQGLWQQVK
jgi:hypothetical protein